MGYTDNTGTDAINNPLSENRAKTVAAYLVAQGSSADFGHRQRRVARPTGRQQ